MPTTDKIIFGFSKPKKFKPFALLIMLGYGIPYSHVYIKFHSDKYNRDLIYQASHSMVNFMGTEIFYRDNIVIEEFEIEISDNKKSEMITFAIDNVGKAYGVKQAFGMAIVRISELIGIKISNPFSDGNQTYVCSELGAYILEHFSGRDIPEKLDDVTPKDLYSYFIKLKENLYGNNG
jgi:hypothetical protein